VLALTSSGAQDERAGAVEAGTVEILGKSVGLDEIMRTMAQLCTEVEAAE
jgi:hypothetical protein